MPFYIGNTQGFSGGSASSGAIEDVKLLIAQGDSQSISSSRTYTDDEIKKIVDRFLGGEVDEALDSFFELVAKLEDDDEITARVLQDLAAKVDTTTYNAFMQSVNTALANKADTNHSHSDYALKSSYDDFVTQTNSSLEQKVDKEAGKSLSTEDFTTALKTKLENTETLTAAEKQQITTNQTNISNLDRDKASIEQLNEVDAAALKVIENRDVQFNGMVKFGEEYKTLVSYSSGNNNSGWIIVKTNIQFAANVIVRLDFESNGMYRLGYSVPNTLRISHYAIGGNISALNAHFFGNIKVADDQAILHVLRIDGKYAYAIKVGYFGYLSVNSLVNARNGLGMSLEQAQGWTVEAKTDAEMAQLVASDVKNRSVVFNQIKQSDENFTAAYKESLDQLPSLIGGKVDIEAGKGLSSNDFTAAYKTSLDNLPTQLSSKIDVVAGKGLSTNDLTDERAEKLDNVEDAKAKGRFTSLASLQAKYPNPEEGWTAWVPNGNSSQMYAVENGAWTPSDVSGTMTPAEVKDTLLANANAQFFDTTQKNKITANETAVTANAQSIVELNTEIALLTRKKHHRTFILPTAKAGYTNSLHGADLLLQGWTRAGFDGSGSVVRDTDIDELVYRIMDNTSASTSDHRYTLDYDFWKAVNQRGLALRIACKPISGRTNFWMGFSAATNTALQNEGLPGWAGVTRGAYRLLLSYDNGMNVRVQDGDDTGVYYFNDPYADILFYIPAGQTNGLLIIDGKQVATIPPYAHSNDYADNRIVIGSGSSASTDEDVYIKYIELSTLLVEPELQLTDEHFNDNLVVEVPYYIGDFTLTLPASTLPAEGGAAITVNAKNDGKVIIECPENDVATNVNNAPRVVYQANQSGKIITITQVQLDSDGVPVAGAIYLSSETITEKDLPTRLKSEVIYSGLSTVITADTATNLLQLVASANPAAGTLEPFFDITTNKLITLNSNQTMHIKLMLNGTFAEGVTSDRSLQLSIVGTKNVFFERKPANVASNTFSFQTFLSIDKNGNLALNGAELELTSFSQDFTLTDLTLIAEQITA